MNYLNPDSLMRATWSAGVWAVVAYGGSMALGVTPELTDVLVDSAIMGGSALGSDVIHNVLGWTPTGMTSAAMTGVSYAAIQRLYRGDESYLVNFGAAAANDYLVDWVANRYAVMYPPEPEAN